MKAYKDYSDSATQVEETARRLKRALENCSLVDREMLVKMHTDMQKASSLIYSLQEDKHNLKEALYDTLQKRDQLYSQASSFHKALLKEQQKSQQLRLQTHQSSYSKVLPDVAQECLENVLNNREVLEIFKRKIGSVSDFEQLLGTSEWDKVSYKLFLFINSMLKNLSFSLKYETKGVQADQEKHFVYKPENTSFIKSPNASCIKSNFHFLENSSAQPSHEFDYLINESETLIRNLSSQSTKLNKINSQLQESIFVQEKSPSYLNHSTSVTLASSHSDTKLPQKGKLPNESLQKENPKKAPPKRPRKVKPLDMPTSEKIVPPLRTEEPWGGVGDFFSHNS